MEKSISKDLVPFERQVELSLEDELLAREGIRVIKFRETDGLSVAMAWDERNDVVFVAVRDTKEGQAFEFLADKAKANEAYEHPFVTPNAGRLATADAFKEAA